MKAKQAYKLVDQLRNPGPRNYYIDCFPKMEPPDNYDEIFEYLRSHTIGEAYADKMLLLLLMLICISFLRSRRSWLISCLSVTASSW